MPRIALLILSLALLLTTPAAARRHDADVALDALPEGRRGSVAQIADGATLVLTDGTTVRLAGIEPVLATPGSNPHWEEAARAALASLVEGLDVVLRGASDTLDRYGRMTAQLVRDDGVWIEAALVEAGAVRVQPPLPPDLAAPLLRREASARRRHLGLWQAPLYAVRTPHELTHEGGSYVIVEASIERVEDRHGILWLALGDEAEARLDRPARQLFAVAGLDPASFAGQKLRLRGWVRWQGRPVLELTTPDAVELPKRKGEHP